MRMPRHRKLREISSTILLSLLCGVQLLFAQPVSDSSSIFDSKPKKWAVGGYIKDLQAVQFVDINQKWTLENLLHIRADVHWYPGTNWTVHVGSRNRLIYGESVPLYLLVPALLGGTNDYLNLSKILAHGESYLLHTTIDRATVDYSSGKWQATLGRQRINWGLNLVWNPNDIFNAYSYFDFDYEERPGTDALKVQYYLNSTSSAELAIKPGKKPDDLITAGLYRFTKGSYDFQALAGWVQTDYVLGAGWSGILGTAGFNGEITAFLPRKNIASSQTTVSASLGANYSFPNSLYLHGAYLLNSTGILKIDSLPPDLFRDNVTAKALSPARHSLFAEVAYQITPLIRGDLAGILDPADGSFFIGPFFTFSLANNMEFLSGGQLFFGGRQTLYGIYGKALYLRFKWSY